MPDDFDSDGSAQNSGQQTWLQRHRLLVIVLLAFASWMSVMGIAYLIWAVVS